MPSREIRDLSPRVQVLHNKLADKVRRDVELRKIGASLILSCTHRTPDEQLWVHQHGWPRTSHISAVGNDGKPASEEFEMVPTTCGMPIMTDSAIDMVREHAQVVGLELMMRSPLVFSFREKK